MKRELIDISAETDPEFSYVVGRNGSAYINRLRARESFAGPHVYITGIGKRGKEIRGGFMVTKECFEEVSRQYLNSARGYIIGEMTPITPEDCELCRELAPLNQRCHHHAGCSLCGYSGPLLHAPGSTACKKLQGLAEDCQINAEGFCTTHQVVHLRETAAAMEVPAGDSVTKEWGMRCPQCCSDEGIEIHASVWLRLHADGTTTDDTFDGSHEWASEDPAQCRRCNFSGTVGDFELADDGSRSTGRKEGSDEV